MSTRFEDLEWRRHCLGERAIVSFPNGYGASILRGGNGFFYTENGTYELTVLKHGKLCYTTPITDDVLPYCSEEKINEVLEQIENLNLKP